MVGTRPMASFFLDPHPTSLWRMSIIQVRDMLQTMPWVAPPAQIAHELTLPLPQTAGSTSACTTAMCW